MSPVDFESLADLFELKAQRTGSIADALRETFEAAQAGTVDPSIGSELARCAPRGRCPMCVEKRSMAPVVNMIEQRRLQRDLPILRAVAIETGFSVAELKSHFRGGGVAKARYRAMWRMRQAKWSLVEIGRTLGGRDHSTVIAGIKRFEAMMAADPALAARMRGYVGIDQAVAS